MNLAFENTRYSADQNVNTVAEPRASFPFRRLLSLCLLAIFLVTAGAILPSVSLHAQSPSPVALETKIKAWYDQTRSIQNRAGVDRLVRFEAQEWTAALQTIRDAAVSERDRLTELRQALDLQLAAAETSDVAANEKTDTPAAGAAEKPEAGSASTLEVSTETELETKRSALKKQRGLVETNSRSLNLLIEQVTQLMSSIQKRASSERLAMVLADRGTPVSTAYWSRLSLHAKAFVSSLTDATFRSELVAGYDGQDWRGVFYALGLLIVAFFARRFIKRGILSHRLFVGDGPTLRKQDRRLSIYVACMLVFWAFVLLGRVVPMGPTLQDFISLLISIPLVISLMSMLASRTQIRSIAPTLSQGVPDAERNPRELNPGQWIYRSCLVLVVLIIPVAFLLGYSNLARLMMSATGATTLVLVVNQLARGYLFQGVRRKEDLKDASSAYGFADAEANVALSALGNRAVLYVAGEIFLIFISAVVVLPFFGLSFKQLGKYMVAIWQGVQYGPIYIQLSSWFGALLVFLVIWFVVGLVRSYMRHRVLPHTGWDGGVQDAILATLTYGGFILAFLAAVSAAGVDMARLALIAGALSVGIGFGLQTIVNNVVSGLILLYERSIKPGDWVRVDGGVEGTIKQVRVRYTEIETFDKASVIVPNASMVGGAVFNMTLGSKLGRLEMQVGIDYACNPRDVVAVLEDVANNFPMARKRPAPFVSFVGFGASSMDFSIKVYLSDVNTISDARTKLAFAVYEGLQDNDISIPFNQVDVRIMSPGDEKPLEGLVDGNRPKLLESQ